MLIKNKQNATKNKYPLLESILKEMTENVLNDNATIDDLPTDENSPPKTKLDEQNVNANNQNEHDTHSMDEW